MIQNGLRKEVLRFPVDVPNVDEETDEIWAHTSDWYYCLVETVNLDGTAKIKILGTTLPVEDEELFPTGWTAEIDLPQFVLTSKGKLKEIENQLMTTSSSTAPSNTEGDAYVAQEFLAEEESAVLTGFLRRSVTDGTAQGYQAGIEKWKEYLGTLDSEHQPGQYLEKVPCQEAKAQRMVLFMAYLYMSEGLREEQIRRAVTCVSYMFEVEGKDTSFLDLAIVSRGRAATSRSSEECRTHEMNRRENVILPICLDIVLGVREEYWENQDWSTKGLDKRAIWLAICLGFDSGLRRETDKSYQERRTKRSRSLHSGRSANIFREGSKIKRRM